MLGRPSVKRKRSESESQGTRVTQSGNAMTCSNCLERGHNARNCRNQKKDPPPKPVKPKGRPKLNISKPTIARRCSSGGRGNKGGRENIGGRISSVVGASYDPIIEETRIVASSNVPLPIWLEGIPPYSISSEAIGDDKD